MENSLLGQYLRNLRKIFQDKLASSSTTAEETFSSIRTVRSFSQDPKAMDLYKKDIDQTYAVGKKISFATGKNIMTLFDDKCGGKRRMDDRRRDDGRRDDIRRDDRRRDDIRRR